MGARLHAALPLRISLGRPRPIDRHIGPSHVPRARDVQLRDEVLHNESSVRFRVQGSRLKRQRYEEGKGSIRCPEGVDRVELTALRLGCLDRDCMHDRASPLHPPDKICSNCGSIGGGSDVRPPPLNVPIRTVAMEADVW